MLSADSLIVGVVKMSLRTRVLLVDSVIVYGNCRYISSDPFVDYSFYMSNYRVQIATQNGINLTCMFLGLFQAGLI